MTCIRPVWQLAELEGDLFNVGGLDIHRKQITSDYLAMITREVRRGRVARLTGRICGLVGPAGAPGRSRRATQRPPAATSARASPRPITPGLLDAAHQQLAARSWSCGTT